VAITGGYNLFQGAGLISETQEEKGSTNPIGGQELEVSDEVRATVKDLIQKKCTICHDLQRVKGAQKNREQWMATVDKMIQYNIDKDFLNQTERTLIISYLNSDWKKDL
jgi:hypothetical protein